MDCKEASEYISAIIDGQIENTIKPRLNEHLKRCSGCRNEFELERLTKHVIKYNVGRVKAPQSLASLISTQLQQEAAAEKTKSSWLGNLFILPTWKTALAVSGALALILILTLIPSRSHHSHANPIDGNIIHQTYNNFDGVLDGKITPQVASDNPSVVHAFFSSKVNFNVVVPRLKHCALVGGVFSEYNNEGIAHVIYKNGNDIIYMCQAKLGSVMDSHVLNISDEAKRDLQRTGWYFENHAPNCSLVMWIDDSTLCCAIGDISKDKLMACLTGND